MPGYQRIKYMIVSGKIIADEKGLSWTAGRRKYHSPWEDVTGYYDQRKPGSDRGVHFAAAEWQSVVKTRSGTFTFYESEQKNARELRSWIKEYATSARDQSWGVMRHQPNDWPPIFSYNTIVTQKNLRRLHYWHRIGLAAVAFYFLWTWETTHTLPGWGWLFTPSGLFFIGKSVLLLAAHFTYHREKPYLNRKVLTNMDGLTFIDGDKRQRVAWANIIDFYRQNGKFIVVTAEGEWDFTAPLDPLETLRKIIPRYAINARQTQWHKFSKQTVTRNAVWYGDKANYDR